MPRYARCVVMMGPEPEEQVWIGFEIDEAVPIDALKEAGFFCVEHLPREVLQITGILEWPKLTRFQITELRNLGIEC